MTKHPTTTSTKIAPANAEPAAHRRRWALGLGGLAGLAALGSRLTALRAARSAARRHWAADPSGARDNTDASSSEGRATPATPSPVSPSPQRESAGVPPPDGAGRRPQDEDPPAHRRRWPVILGAIVVIAGIAAAVMLIRGDGTAGANVGDSPEGTATPATELATVQRRTITAQQQVNGTLGFDGDFQVAARTQGTITEVPDVGATVRQGEVLFRIDGRPVILLNGTVPAWRKLTTGTTGPDAQQLNAALVALGYDDGLDLDPTSKKITSATTKAITKLQAALDISKTGELPLGTVVFLPGPLRITGLEAPLGAPIGPGQTVLQATSTTPQVTADLPVALARQVSPGDAVTVTMPDLSTAAGTVSRVGTVATESQGESTATIPVVVSLSDPSAAAHLDQASVLVAITTATAQDAMVVPVTALLALAGGRYAVEVADDAGTHLVTVHLGLFDNAGGVVQVTGDLHAGQKVTVPAS